MLPALTVTVPPDPAPADHAVPVTGPLLVFSDRLGGAVEAGGFVEETRRLYVYDLGARQYWTAFDYGRTIPRNLVHICPPSIDETCGSYFRRFRLEGYFRFEYGFPGYFDALAIPSSVQVAGTGFVVSSNTHVWHVSLDGRVATTLFEHQRIRNVAVSPDGTRVAIMHGEPGTLLVVDVASGDELLSVGSDHPGLVALRGAEPDSTLLTLGEWSANGEAISIAANSWYGGYRTHPARRLAVAILTLDGDVDVLPDGWTLSRNLRYAFRPSSEHPGLAESVDVIDIESGRVIRTVGEADGRVVLPDSWHQGPDRFVYLDLEASARSRMNYVADYELVRRHLDDWERGRTGVWGKVAKIEGFEPRVLDIATGDIEALDRVGWADLWAGDPRCLLWCDGRVVWEGNDRRFVGYIELDAPLALRGITLLDPPRAPAPPPDAPPREEMVGPLLAWSMVSQPEYEIDGFGVERRYDGRRLMVHDAGTDRSWRAHEYSRSEFGTADSVQVAHEGFIVWARDEVRYVTFDGRTELLLVADERITDVTVAPDGGKVAVRLWELEDLPEDYFHGGEGFLPNVATLLIYDLPAGVELVRVTDGDPRFPEIARAEQLSVGLGPWSADGTELTVLGYTYDQVDILGFVGIDGTIRMGIEGDLERALDILSEPRERPDHARVDCPDDRIQSCTALLDGDVIGEGRWATIIDVVALH